MSKTYLLCLATLSLILVACGDNTPSKSDLKRILDEYKSGGVTFIENDLPEGFIDYHREKPQKIEKYKCRPSTKKEGVYLCRIKFSIKSGDILYREISVKQINNIWVLGSKSLQGYPIYVGEDDKNEAWLNKE